MAACALAGLGLSGQRGRPGKPTSGHAKGLALPLYYRVMSPLPPAYLSKKLDRPLPTTDGGILRTIRDACDYMTSMDKKRELRQHWQRLAKLILAKADVTEVSRALELALFMDAKLDVAKVSAG
jgi:hypothetical protein